MGQAVEREVVLPATLERVWETLVDPAELGEWLAADVELDARPGGAAVFTVDGVVRVGVVEEVEHERRLSYRWWPEGRDSESSRVTLTIDAVPSGTRLVVIEAPVDGANQATPQASAAWGLRCTALVWRTGACAVRA